MKTSTNFAPEVRERAVRLMHEHQGEHVLNHTLQGIAKVYNHHDDSAEKRMALEAGVLRLRQIIGETNNVVFFKRVVA